MIAPSRSYLEPPAVADEVMSVETIGFDELRAHVRVAGELDLSTGAPLSAVLQSHLAAGRRYLRLDLSGVEFLDAAVLSGIARAHHGALAARGQLLLTGVRPSVDRVIRIAGLAGVLLVAERSHP